MNDPIYDSKSAESLTIVQTNPSAIGFGFRRLPGALTLRAWWRVGVTKDSTQKFMVLVLFLLFVVPYALSALIS